MSGHFSAFSFVDRISSVEPGRHIRGSYRIPSKLELFPLSLVAEAVGQLAAWAAMAAVDFKSRPVAGLAASIDLLSGVSPGQVLELAAELETMDEDAVGYDGTAHVKDVPVIRLQHCVGPMVPIEQFDDPQALRRRFTLLCGAGAAPEAFEGVPALNLQPAGGESGRSLRATLVVPDDAPFFTDHFPRQRVLPGALLMHANLEVVARLLPQIPAPTASGKWVPREVSDVKLRAFTPPGETLQIEAGVAEVSAAAALVDVETRRGNRIVGSCRVRLMLEERP